MSILNYTKNFGYFELKKLSYENIRKVDELSGGLAKSIPFPL